MYSDMSLPDKLLAFAYVLCIGAAFACWVTTLIHIYRRNAGLAILGVVCWVFTFLYGWVMVREFDNLKIMIVWSVVILLFCSLPCLALLGATLK